MMEMNEIPMEVLESVRNKWSKILESGEWDASRIWVRCSMCYHVDKNKSKRESCIETCPLSKDDWCNEGGINSRLSLVFHKEHEYYNACEGTTTREAWLTSVERFVKMLNKLIEERKDNETLRF